MMDGQDLPQAADRRRNAVNRQLLPAEAYTSEAWFRREQAELFAKVWQFAGLVEDLKAPGDYRAIDLAGAPYLLLRDENNQLRAFHNICRHRGARLLDGSGNVGNAIVCFYHRWAYGLDGALQGMPQAATEFPTLDKSCFGLIPVKLATWRNLIFINADPNAAPLEQWLAGGPDQIVPHQPENLVEVADLMFRVRANWKIVVENFIDSYHLFYLHSVSLGDGDFFGLKQWPAGRHWLERRGLKQGKTHAKMMLPVIDGVPPTYGFHGCWVFPNLGLTALATHWLTFHVMPQSAELSFVQLRIRAAREALEAIGDHAPPPPEALPDYVVHAKGPYTAIRLDPRRDVAPLESNNVTREDIYACEAIQRGMHSPRWSVGALSSWEEALTFFQQQVTDYVAL